MTYADTETIELARQLGFDEEGIYVPTPNEYFQSLKTK